MAQFKIKVKSNFKINGGNFEKGMEVDIYSKQTSAPNLLSAGKQEIIDSFKTKFGLSIDSAHMSSTYLDVVKI